jgi:predicted CXXCH cytochrome family protein
MAPVRRSRLLSVAILVVVSSLAFTSAQGGDECLVCHSTMGDKPSSLYRADIHFRKGISCSGCHGGNAATDDADKAMDTTAGFVGVPKGDGISQMCARCHSDQEKMKSLQSSIPTGQLALLQGSVHGKSVTKGQGRIAQCTTCHGVHNIAAVKSPTSPVHPLNIVATCARCHSDPVYVRSYNPSLPVDQQEKYRTSVHGMRNAKGDGKTAECASCHGSHNILPSSDVRSTVYPTNLPGTCSRCHSDVAYMKEYHIPTDQFEKYSKSVHGIALLQKNDLGAPACNKCHGNHGAAPPGVESVSKVCGTCHALNADLFSGSPHKKAFDERHLPECETCHGKHEIIIATNRLLGVSQEAVCSRCHNERELPAGYAAAIAMRGLIDSLEAGEAQARAAVEEAEQKGMEISEAKYKLREIRQARLEARTMVHAFNEEKFRVVVVKGLGVALWVSREGQQALKEYVFRRVGLGIATLIITVLAFALWLFIRRLEREKTVKHHSTT